VPLFTRLLYAAGMNGHDDVLEALGQAFGDAVREPSKVNEAEPILAMMPATGAGTSVRWPIVALRPTRRRSA
jgi:hypothetical protein